MSPQRFLSILILLLCLPALQAGEFPVADKVLIEKATRKYYPDGIPEYR